MTRLTLLRHAKSIWEKKDSRDIDRTLNSRGRREATLMGLVCEERLPPPDLLLVSSAKRTRETVELFFEAWKEAEPAMEVVEALYLAGLEELLEIVEERAVVGNHLIICSHQPGLGDFASWLCPDFRGRVPPAAVISILVDSGPLKRFSGTLDFTGTPADFQI